MSVCTALYARISWVGVGGGGEEDSLSCVLDLARQTSQAGASRGATSSEDLVQILVAT
jgi:hypothetical protein